MNKIFVHELYEEQVRLYNASEHNLSSTLTSRVWRNNSIYYDRF